MTGLWSLLLTITDIVSHTPPSLDIHFAFVHPLASRAVLQHVSTMAADGADSSALDHRFFPHLVHLVVSFSTYPVLITFRATSRELKTKVDKIILRHIVIENRPADFAALPRERFELRSLLGPLPFPPVIDFVPGLHPLPQWTRLLAQYTAVIDMQCDDTFASREAFQESLPCLRTIRSDHLNLFVHNLGAPDIICFCPVFTKSDYRRLEFAPIQFASSTFQRLVLNVHVYGHPGPNWFSTNFLLIVNQPPRSSKPPIVCTLATVSEDVDFQVRLSFGDGLPASLIPPHFTIVNLDETNTNMFNKNQARFARECIQMSVGFEDRTAPCAFHFLSVDEYRKTISNEQFQLETVFPDEWTCDL